MPLMAQSVSHSTNTTVVGLSFRENRRLNARNKNLELGLRLKSSSGSGGGLSVKHDDLHREHCAQERRQIQEPSRVVEMGHRQTGD